MTSLIDLKTIVDDIAAVMALETERGQVANYTPDLACISPQKFGISIALERLVQRTGWSVFEAG